MPRVVHFEIPAKNPEQSLSFYEEVFGWQFSRWGEEEYWLADTGDKSEHGINGAIIKRKNPAQPVTNTIQVKDLDKTIERINNQGGEVVVDRQHVPGIGSYIYFKDPDGNIVGAMQPESGD